jgi:hypothetical protein
VLLKSNSEDVAAITGNNDANLYVAVDNDRKLTRWQWSR